MRKTGAILQTQTRECRALNRNLNCIKLVKLICTKREWQTDVITKLVRRKFNLLSILSRAEVQRKSLAFALFKCTLMMCLHWSRLILVSMELDLMMIIGSGYSGLEKCVHCTYANSYSNSDSNGYCTQFDTDISSDKVILKVIFTTILPWNDHWNRSWNRNRHRYRAVETHHKTDANFYSFYTHFSGIGLGITQCK